METSSNIIVGTPDVKPSTPSHTVGVREGNKRSFLVHEPGITPTGPLWVKATARRSTGINAKARRPIDPRMPILTPA